VRRTSRGLAALSIAAAASVALAPAATAVTNVDVNCESGASKYLCDVYHDAQAPSTVRWYINGSYVSALDDRTFIGLRSCSGGSYVTVQAVVADATGSTTGSTGFRCNTGPWP
jgi:hypothetical protein